MHRACLLVAALALAAPRPALAQPADEAGNAEARALGEQALRHFQAARWQEALDLFRRAEAILHAPTLVLYTAHCQARLGHLAEARRLYRAVVQEHIAEDAPVQFRTAQGIAQQELRWIELRLALLKVAVTGVPAEEARVLLDGAPVASADLEDLAVEPGEHVVEASSSEAAPVRRTFTAVAGRAVSLSLALEPAAKPPPPPPPLAPVAPPPPPRAMPNLFVPAVSALGAGGAALLVGTVTGAVSLHIATGVKSRCTPDGHCLIADQDSAASAGRLADASTAMFVLGSLAAASGVALYVVHLRSRAPAAPSSARIPLPHIRIGPGYGLVGGTF